MVLTSTINTSDLIVRQQFGTELITLDICVISPTCVLRSDGDARRL
jgi:hypothetical protein